MTNNEEQTTAQCDALKTENDNQATDETNANESNSLLPPSKTEGIDSDERVLSTTNSTTNDETNDSRSSN